MNANVSMGADPEFFLQDSVTGKVIPVAGKIGFSKKNPKQLDKMLTGCMLQEDNIMVEYNIPPATNKHEFHEYMVDTVNGVMNYLRQWFGNNNLTIYPHTSYLCPLSELTAKEATVFGCAPDNDAYNKGKVIKKYDPEDFEDGESSWRFAGGHIHLGYSSQVPHFVVANFADLFLGLLGVCYGWEQGERSRFYGTAGRYRAKPYGIEYRTLSNIWSLRSEYIDVVGSAGFGLLSFLSNSSVEEIQTVYQEIPWFDVQKAINTEDRSLAVELNSWLHIGKGNIGYLREYLGA